MNMPGPDSGIARFLTIICDLIFLNVVFLLTSCTVWRQGTSVPRPSPWVSGPATWCWPGGGDTLAATVEVSEMMGSKVHFHANAEGKDVVVIVPTMNAEGEHIGSFRAGDKLNLTFSGNVCHLFDSQGRNLEF